MFTEEQKRELEKLILEVIQKQPRQMLHQSDFVPGVVKREAIEDMVITRGLIADRPTDGDAVGVLAYFSTDNDTLAIWNGSAWVEEILT